MMWRWPKSWMWMVYMLVDLGVGLLRCQRMRETIGQKTMSVSQEVMG